MCCYASCTPVISYYPRRDRDRLRQGPDFGGIETYIYVSEPLWCQNGGKYTTYNEKTPKIRDRDNNRACESVNTGVSGVAIRCAWDAPAKGL